MNKKIGIIALVLIVLVGGYFYLNREQNISINIKNDQILDISLNLPLTGPFSTYGEAIRDGVLMAKEDISSNVEINLSIQDNRSEAKTSVNILKQQLLKDNDIYISGVKPQTMAIIDEVSKKSIPHFTWVFDAFITQNYKNTYRTWVSYKLEPEYYFKYIEKQKPKKIAIAYVKLPHTDEEFLNIIVPYLKKNNIEFLIEDYNFGVNDFKTIGVKFKDYNPDLLILNGFKGELISMVKYFQEINLSNKNGNTICTFDFLDAAEDLDDSVKNGIRFVAPEFITKLTDERIKWSDKFEMKFGRKPRYTDAYAYDMMSAIIHASKNVKDFSNAEEWNIALKSIAFEGITGKFKFDDSGDLITPLDVVYFEDSKILIDIE
ncbi:MAG: ABC transporter substrate-binding protein [Bacteroidetes bacterium]|nr:ABC transporter substrate-binding protein [Bacteroidota bacterium]